MAKSSLASRFAISNESRWTEEDAHSVLEKASTSSKSLSAFARGQGLNPQRLYWWRSRLAAQRPATVGFQEVRLPTESLSSFEVVLRDGLVIRVPASFDPAALCRLLAVLVESRGC